MVTNTVLETSRLIYRQKYLKGYYHRIVSSEFEYPFMIFVSMDKYKISECVRTINTIHNIMFVRV